MRRGRAHTWQSIHARICKHIDDQTWAPGELIPGEEELARRFGCARTTVNRALRELAAAGMLDRKRKAGTRVAKLRARRATTDIPVIKTQVESLGKAYRFEVVSRRELTLPVRVAARMKLPAASQALQISTVHYADERPFVFEQRWINLQSVPDIRDMDFRLTSVNEWLVQHMPFTAGRLQVSARAASKSVARALQLSAGDAVLYSERQTWLSGESITLAGMYYTQDFQMDFEF